MNFSQTGFYPNMNSGVYYQVIPFQSPNYVEFYPTIQMKPPYYFDFCPSMQIEPPNQSQFHPTTCTVLTNHLKLDNTLNDNLQRTNSRIYSQFLNYVATLNQLKSHGYPLNFDNGSVYIEPSSKFPSKNFQLEPQISPSNKITDRTCCRCNVNYLVDSNGNYLAPKSCFYHWGKIRNRNSFYSCCNQSYSSKGCTEAVGHVTLGRTTGNCNGFVKAKPRKTKPKDADYGVYALDCEMSFTTRGLDLVKISFVRSDGLIVYNELVRPDHPIIDLNTRFSGISEDVFLNATKSLAEVRDDLLKFIHEETILVGHGLENDLKALRLAHENVVDTAIVFPHYLGLPYRRSLKQLIGCVLKKEIQCGEHDSVEDARACMQLMLRKIKIDCNL